MTLKFFDTGFRCCNLPDFYIPLYEHFNEHGKCKFILEM